MTPDRFRVIRRVVGMGAFGVVVFLVSLMLAFPYEKVRDQIVAIAAAQNLDVQVGSTGPTFGFGVVLEDVTVRTRPEPGKRPSVIPVERARIDVSPLAQLRGEFAYSLEIQAFDGHIDTDEHAEKTGSHSKIATREINLAQLPGVKQAINLPLAGRLTLSLDLTKPNHRNGEASGHLSWLCAGCGIGDGKEKLKIASDPMLAQGLSFPRVTLGDFAGKVQFQKGVGRLQGVHSRSPDGELFIDGEVRLADPIGYSYLNLYVRFKLSEALLRRAQNLQLLLQLADAGKRSDGFYGFRLSGSLARLNSVQWMQTSPFPAAGAGFGGRTAAPPPTGPSGRRSPGSLRAQEQPATGSTIVDPQSPGANIPRYATQPRRLPPTTE
jgi:type II secretion system protein N